MAAAVWISSSGPGRLVRTRLSEGRGPAPYAAQRSRHSARAAMRFCLKICRLERLRSWLKWLKTEAWMDANFCNVRMRRKRSIARSRLRKGKREFSAGLSSQRPVSCLSRMPGARRIPQQDAAERALNKLARTYTMQIEALKRYRTGGQQRVIVEHVTVNAGGQPIVGAVTVGGGVKE